MCSQDPAVGGINHAESMASSKFTNPKVRGGLPRHWRGSPFSVIEIRDLLMFFASIQLRCTKRPLVPMRDRDDVATVNRELRNWNRCSPRTFGANRVYLFMFLWRSDFKRFRRLCF